jgi:hypothetical protein
MMTRMFLFLCFLVLACSAQAQSPDTRRQLSDQLVELMKVRTMIDASLQQCNQSSGSRFDPKVEFRSSPGSFGGISPQSSYWPEVEAIYGRYRATACAYVTPDKLASHYSQLLAQRSSEEDLRAAVAYFSSPAGRRMQDVAVQINESFQKFSQELMLQAYEMAREQFQVEFRVLLRQYQKEPR